MPGVGLVFEDPEFAPGRLDAAAVRALARHRDRPDGAPPAGDRASTAAAPRRCSSDARRPRLPGRAPALPDREGPARGLRAPACASSTPTCSPAGTSSTSTSPSSTARRPARRAPRARPRARDAPPRAAAARPRGSRQATIPGRVVLDGIHLLRGAFVRMDDYGLDAVARAVLGEGKTLAGHGRAERDPAALRGGPGAPRRVQPHRRPARARDPRAAPPRRARGRAQPPHRHAARSRRLLDRRVRLPLPRRARAAADRRPERPRGGRGRGAPGRRATSSSPSRALRERRRARLQEPVPEPHPHLRDRPAEPRPARGRPGGRRPHRGPERRRLRAGARASCARSSTSFCLAARRRAGRGRRRQEPGHQDPHELLLRRARDAGLPLPRPAPRQRHHALRPRDAAVVPGPDRGGRRTGCSTATPTACSWRPARTEAEAARAFGEALAARLNRDLARHVADRWRVESRLDLVFDRLYLRLCLPAMRHGTAGARKRYAGLVEDPTARGSSSPAWRPCAATGPTSPGTSSASSMPGCSPTSPSSSTCARWSRTSRGAPRRPARLP